MTIFRAASGSSPQDPEHPPETQHMAKRFEKRDRGLLGIPTQAAIKSFFGGNAVLSIAILLSICIFLGKEALMFFPDYHKSLQLYRKSGLEYVDHLKIRYLPTDVFDYAEGLSLHIFVPEGPIRGACLSFVGGGFASYDLDNVAPGADDSDTGLLVAGNIGLEYDFDIPLILSLDFRPEIGFGDINDDLDFDIALGIRYQF